jgi:hypothetical protein
MNTEDVALAYEEYEILNDGNEINGPCEGGKRG